MSYCFYSRTERAADVLCQIAWALMTGIAAALVLAPLFSAIARADTVAVPAYDEVALDLGGLALAAVLVTLGVEVVRVSVPWLSRGHDLTEPAKVVLRVLSIGIGLLAGVLEWAPAIGDGSQPAIFGGVGAGLLASVFGAQIMGTLRRRMTALVGET